MVNHCCTCVCIVLPYKDTLSFYKKSLLVIFFNFQNCSSNEGKEFVVIFLENRALHGSLLYLYMTTRSSEAVNVSITTPTWNSTDAVGIAVTATNNNITTVHLPESLQLANTVKDTKVVHVVAEDDIVLYAGNLPKKTGDSFIVYPTNTLGRSYTVATFDSDNTYLPALGIAAIEDDTEIHINFSTNASVTLEGTNYNGTLTIYLEKFEVVQIIHESLNGAIIHSNKDIIVHSGHVFLKVTSAVSGSSSSDHTEEQLLPTKFWSTEYVLVSSQYQDSLGDFVRIYSSQTDTTITIDNGTTSEVQISSAGSHIDFKMLGSPMLITGDKPIQVAQFGISSGGGHVGDPYLTMPSATSQYKDGYTFLTPSMGSWSEFSIQISLIVNVHAKEDVSLDGAQMHLPWERVGQSEYYFARINISEGVHNIKTGASGGVLGGMVYGFAANDQYGTSIGKYLPDDSKKYKVRFKYPKCVYCSYCILKPIFKSCIKKIENVTRGIQDEKSRKDTASSEN